MLGTGDYAQPVGVNRVKQAPQRKSRIDRSIIEIKLKEI